MAQQSIGIDCRLGGIAHAGIGRYIAELVKRITKSTRDIRWVLFCFNEEQAAELLDGKTVPNVEIVITPIRQYTLREQLELPKFFNAAQVDLLHVPHFNVPLLYSKPFVVTIHDLLWHEYKGMHVTTLPPLLYWPKYWAYRFIAKNAIAHAKKIFVPTKTVAKIITNYYPNYASKITVTYEGIGSSLLEIAKKARMTQRKKNHILYVGSLYPHKNVSIVLEALQEMKDYTFTIIGARNAFQKQIEKEVAARGLTNQVTFLGRVSDEELAKNYQTAGCVVQPSVSEGFGLTGLEALSFSAPLVASNIPILHEVYQNAAIYFDHSSAKACRQAIEQATSTEYQKTHQQKAKQVVAQYDWNVLTETTLEGYQTALKGS